MATLYASHPLRRGVRSIRVLDVLPSLPDSNSDAQPIACHMRIIDLDSQERFTALSYVWGERTPIKTSIVCDDTEIEVSNNCYDALKHLREKLGSFTIWVDAVCIEQSNDCEKLHQLPLMGSIYHNASAVYIWLGENTESTDKAMRYLSRAGYPEYCNTEEPGKFSSRPYAAAWSMFLSSWSRSKSSFPPRTKRKNRVFSSNMTTQEDIASIFSNRWITRLWTFQELVLATNPIVVCGQQHISWSSFEKSSIFIATAGFSHHSRKAIAWQNLAFARRNVMVVNEADPTSTQSLVRYSTFIKKVWEVYLALELLVFILLQCMQMALIWSVVTFVRHKFERHKRWIPIVTGCGLSWIICFTMLLGIRLRFRFSLRIPERSPPEGLSTSIYNRKAKEPRDMAFGIWPVLQQKTHHSLLLPKYTDNLGHVYWTFAIHLIQVTQSLDLLYLAAAQGIPELPSWVPDWSAANQHTWPSRSDSDEIELTTFDGSAKDVFFEFDSTKSILTVHGQQICRIDSLACCRKTGDYYEEAEQELHVENLSIMLGCSYWSKLGTLRFPFNIFTTLGVFSLQHDKEADKIKQWAKFCRTNRRKDPSQVLSYLVRESSPTVTSILKTQIEICNLLAQQSRMFFYTSKMSLEGHYPQHGICARNAQVGDEIVKVHGLSQLLVVRKCPESERSVRIVSPAKFIYLKNLMWKGPPGSGIRGSGILGGGIQTVGELALTQVESEMVKYHIH